MLIFHSLPGAPPFAFRFLNRIPGHSFQCGIQLVEPEAGNALFPVDAIGLHEYAEVLLLPVDGVHSQVAEGGSEVMHDLDEYPPGANHRTACVAFLQMDFSELIRGFRGRGAAIKAFQSSLDLR